MRSFGMLLMLLMLLPLSAAIRTEAQDRLYVLNSSDHLFFSLRKRILFSRKYRGRYYRQFPFRPIRYTEYRLGQGESLYDVASALGISVDSIATSSGIKFIHGTRPGQMLLIPDFQGILFQAPYRVSLRWIAARYSVSVADIRRLNRFTGTHLARGAALYLPGAHMTALEQALFYGTAFACPLPLPTITSRFGLRRDPVSGSLAFHGGIDLAAPVHTPVAAAHDGVVEFTGWAGGYGKLVVLRHAFGYRTFYGHLSAITVRKGRQLKRGRLLGRVGSTGYSTGPHLHFEIRHYNRRINPLDYAAADHRQQGRWAKNAR